MNVASPRSVTRRKRHVAHNLDRFGPRGAYYPTSCMLRGSGLIECDYKMMRLDDRLSDEIERGVPASPYKARGTGLQVGLGKEY
jgi:hypothetical protein